MKSGNGSRRWSTETRTSKTRAGERPGRALCVRELLRKRFPLISFGVFSIFYTAPGQTFFISLIIPRVLASHPRLENQFEWQYSLATFLAALLLNPAGRFIDKSSPFKILLFNTTAFALGCLLLSAGFLGDNFFWPVLALFLLRLFGQGVFGLTASTFISRSFDRNRGKASGIMSLGFPLSEIVFPPLLLVLLSLVNWQAAYQVLALSLFIVFLPVAWVLLRLSRLPPRGETYPEERPEAMGGLTSSRSGAGQDRKAYFEGHYQYRLGECLRELRFHALLAAACLPPVVMTALFFHQGRIFEWRGWPPEWAAWFLASYAVTKAAGSLFMGPVVDRLGPFLPFTLVILLLATGPLFILISDAAVWGFLYLSWMGAALGFSTPVSSVIWPRLFGIEHLGSIKGFVGTFRNGLTGLGPVGLALLFQSGWSEAESLLLISGVTLALAFLPLLVSRLSRLDFIEAGRAA